MNSYSFINTVLVMSLTGSVLIILLLAIKPLIRNRLPKAIQYYLWLVVLFAMLVPASQFINIPASKVEVPNISTAVDYYVAPFIYTPEYMDAGWEANLPPVIYDVSEVNHRVVVPVPEINQEYEQNYDTGQKTQMFNLPDMTTIIFCIYGLGVFVYFAYIFYTYVIYIKKLKAFNRKTDPNVQAVLSRLCAKSKTKLPLIYLNPLAETPMLIGFFAPKIILPLREYNEIQLVNILHHELVHLKRKDMLIKWLSLFVGALHWFNPLVLIMRREIDRVCELACDETVIKDLNDENRRNYGNTLIYVAASHKRPSANIAATMCEEKKDLKARLSAIMKSKKYPLITLLASAVLVLVVILVAIFLGSGRTDNEKENESNPQTAKKLYLNKTIEIPETIYAVDVVMTENAAYYLEAAGAIIRIDYDGNIKELFSLPERETFYCLFIDEDGIFNILTASENEDDNSGILTVHRYDSNGSKRGSTILEGAFAKSDSYHFPVDFLIAEGYYYVHSVSGLYVYDREGQLIYDVPGDKNMSMKSLLVMEDGRVASTFVRNTSRDTSFILRIYDIKPSLGNATTAENDFEEHRLSIVGSVQEGILTGGGVSPLMLGDVTGLFIYEWEKDDRLPLLNLMEQGLTINDIRDFYLTPDGELILVLKRFFTIAGDILVFSDKSEAGTDTADVNGGITKTEAEVPETGETNIQQTPLKEKEIITLAIVELDFWSYWLSDAIAAFNMSNPDYIVQTNIYKTGADTDTDDALRRFNIDIGTGNVSDITVFPERSIPLQSYFNKGIFADLYEFMDNDPYFNKNDYLVNAFEVLETDGKLYNIFPSFQMSIVVAKTADVGRVPGWTIDEFITFLDSKPDANSIIEGGKYSFIQQVIINYFADMGTGRFNFDRELLIKILETAERIQDPPAFKTAQDYYDYRLGVRSGDPLLLSAELQDGFGFIQQLQVVFGEEVTLMGYPAPGGSGSRFRPGARFAIAEKSDMKEGAWQFIKFMLENFQDEFDIRMPIKISELEKMADKALAESVNWWDRRFVIGFDDKDQTIMQTYEKNTPEDNQKVMELLMTTRIIEPADWTTMRIIMEELHAYLAGQKSIDMVIDIIENRINLYLSEME